jgi:Uma2 family endonuclease
MSLAVSPPEKKLMTAEEFLALPDDGKERWLIRGEVRPKEPAMSVRNRFHSTIEANIVFLLKDWMRDHPELKGIVASGDAGFRLHRTPDSLVGIDVAYAAGESVAVASEEFSYFEGAPILAVEILSPSDKHAEIMAKIRDYLQAGSVVWEVDPDLQAVRVHRPNREPEMFTRSQELTTESELPGFRVPVARIFAD